MHISVQSRWCKILINMILEHRSSHKQHSYICSNNQQYIDCMAQKYIFLLCQKSLDIKIMIHEDITYRKYIKTQLLISNM